MIALAPTPASITTSPTPTKKPESTAVFPPAAPVKDDHLSSPPATSAPTKPLASTVKSTPPAPATVASAPPVKMLTPAEPSRQLTQSWSAETGSTLYDTLEAWVKHARRIVCWGPQDFNYPIEAPLTFHGSFKDAISELFPLYNAAERPFLVNASRPQFLIIIKERKN